jgi:hypothetical protein
MSCEVSLNKLHIIPSVRHGAQTTHHWRDRNGSFIFDDIVRMALHALDGNSDGYEHIVIKLTMYPSPRANFSPASSPAARSLPAR